MWNKAVEWAKAQKETRFRVNQVHGEDEIKMVLEDTFAKEQTVEEEMGQHGSFEVEAREQ